MVLLNFFNLILNAFGQLRQLSVSDVHMVAVNFVYLPLDVPDVI